MLLVLWLLGQPIGIVRFNICMKYPLEYQQMPPQCKILSYDVTVTVMYMAATRSQSVNAILSHTVT